MPAATGTGPSALPDTAASGGTEAANASILLSSETEGAAGGRARAAGVTSLRGSANAGSSLGGCW